MALFSGTGNTEEQVVPSFPPHEPPLQTAPNGSPQHVPHQAPPTEGPPTHAPPPQQVSPTQAPHPQQVPPTQQGLSLQDLQNPQTFQLDTTPPSKRKITKAEFENAQQGQRTQPDPNDPFAELDPLWGKK